MLGFNLNDVLGPINQQFGELITELREIKSVLEDIRENTENGKGSF